MHHATREIAPLVGDKDKAMLARGADPIGNFIYFAPPADNFTPENLALYDEIRSALITFLMVDTTNAKGL